MNAMVYARLIKLAESLNRYRSLSDEETDWLEHALRVEAKIEGRSRNMDAGKRFWNGDERKLKKMLARGKSPDQIAITLQRTPSAVYRKMHKLGLRCGQAQLEAAE